MSLTLTRKWKEVILFYAFLTFMCPFLLISQETSLRFTPQQLFLDNNEACAVMDVNNDGKLDITAGRLWYEAPDFLPRPLRSIARHGHDYAMNNGEYAWDVDGDGWKDIVSTAWEDTYIRWYKNPGREGYIKGLQWEGKPLADTKNGRSEAGYMVDIDGNGRPEYVLNSWDKKMPFTIWRFSRNVFGDPVMLGTMIGSHNSHGVGFGDINGDGRMDILFDDGWYEQPADNLWKGNWPLHQDIKIDRGSCPMQIVDVNGDGRNDIIWGRGHGYGLYWMEQGTPKGDTTTWTNHTIDESWSQVHAMLWTDLDGNGKPELITGKRIWAHSGKDPGSSDTAFIYRYVWDEEREKFQRHVISKGNIGTGLFLRVADMNGDGKKDIVTAGKTGTYILWQK